MSSGAQTSGELLALALALADAADAAAMRHFQDNRLDMWAKSDGSRVTAADIACESAILAELRAHEPDAAVLSEEAGGSPEPGKRWIVDPIDGTENFSRGNPVWGTLIAREIDGAPAVAVISAPALGRRWWAVRGEGAFTADGRRLRVSPIRSLDQATFCYGGLHECPTPADRAAVVAAAERFRCAWGWGNYWAHVQVAEGSAELALSFGVRLWDIAAPALLVAEAGGTHSDAYDGCALTGDSLLTGNGHFADVLTLPGE